MEKISLTTEAREKSKHGAKDLRANGYIPAVLYGHGTDTIDLKVPENAFVKVFDATGYSAIVTLDVPVDGKSEERNVLIHEVQYDAVTGDVIHVDFFQIRMDEKITTEIPVIIEGTSPAVKEQGGILITNLDRIEISCLPGDLVHDVKLSVDGLVELHDALHVKDIELPDTIEVLTSPDETIVFVEEPRSQEELESLDEEITEDVDAVEGPAAAEDDDEEAEGEEGASEEEAQEKTEDKE